MRRLLLLFTFAAVTACSLQPRPELPVEAALAPGGDSELDRRIAPIEAQHPGESAFRLVTEGTEAFAARAQGARLATRSLDVQTYIWHDDDTGLFLAHQLLETADRGVKVRLLLDDMDARAKNAGLAALAAHPNIDVRMFNPFTSRAGALRRWRAGAAGFRHGLPACCVSTHSFEDGGAHAGMCTARSERATNTHERSPEDDAIISKTIPQFEGTFPSLAADGQWRLRARVRPHAATTEGVG